MKLQRNTIALPEPISAFEKSLLQSSMELNTTEKDEMKKLDSQSMLELMKLKIL